MRRFHGRNQSPVLPAGCDPSVLARMKSIGRLLLLGLIATLSIGAKPEPTPSVSPPQETIATTDTGTVRKITANHGNLITTLRAADLEALGIEVGHIFTLRIGEKDHDMLYGQRYEDVPVGGWVAVAKDGDLIWIARNGVNAAESVQAKVGTAVRVQPQR